MTRPFVYINVSGGIAEATAYGDVDTLLVDWDNYQDNADYDIEDIDNKIAELEAKWPNDEPDSYRQSILDDLRKVRQTYINNDINGKAYAEELRQEQLSKAKVTLLEAGYRIEKP